jgi:uncharacterized protein
VPDLPIALLLLAAGILAGVTNAIAGGGTFFSFPVFLAAGIPPVVANASNAVAVWPGHALAVAGYRRELRGLSRHITGSIGVALTGGIVGALLLAQVGNAAFGKLIPFLILFATVLFAFGRGLGAWISARTAAAPLANPGLMIRVMEFLFAVYGGFFGAGLGIMLMAGLLMLGVHDIQANNALKNLLGAAVTSVSVLVFAASGLVSWPHTSIAFAGAILGGLLWARLARVLPAKWLHRVVVAVGLALSVHYFRQYHVSGA